MALVETLTAVCREFSNWHLLIEEVPGRRTQLPGSIFCFHEFDRNRRNPIKVSHARRLDWELDHVKLLFPLSSLPTFRFMSQLDSLTRKQHLDISGFLGVGLSGQSKSLWGFQ